MVKKKIKKGSDRDSIFNSMAESICAYIESMGGTAVVVGGVKVGQEIGAMKYNYFIQVGVTGKMPTKRNI